MDADMIRTVSAKERSLHSVRGKSKVREYQRLFGFWLYWKIYRIVQGNTWRVQYLVDVTIFKHLNIWLLEHDVLHTCT